MIARKQYLKKSFSSFNVCCEEYRNEIALCAYTVYLKSGEQHGNDLQHWLNAETQVRSLHASEKHAHLQAKSAASR